MDKFDFHTALHAYTEPLLDWRALPLNFSAQAFQGQLGHTLMQQWLAGASFVVSGLLVLATIAAGWITLWHTTLKDIGFFREIMGLNRPKADVKAQRQASVKAEIERIKRQHSRPLARSNSIRSSSGKQQEQQQAAALPGS